jgi:uncharacterized protein YlxW (UPF0749 family)
VKNETEYKSPRRKLVTFFEKSRDQWKEKSSEAKAKVKLLNNRVRFLEKSKEKLKSEIKSLKIELTLAKSMKKTEEAENDEQKKSSQIIQ